jgi:hypothetical protein
MIAANLFVTLIVRMEDFANSQIFANAPLVLWATIAL